MLDNTGCCKGERRQWRKQRTEAGTAVAECEGLLPPKHDAGTATRHYRAFWQRRCRAADAVPQMPERCLSRKAGIVRCCLNIVIPFWLLSPLFISSRSSPPSRTGWRRSCRCRWPPWPGTMPRTALPDGNMPQHLPRSWNTFALGWGMPFADFTHTNKKHRAAMQGVLLLAARCFVVSGYCRVIVSFWQAVCPRPTANPMRRRQGRGTRSGRTVGTRWG